MKEFGLVHIYCGDGKGKTTASVGLSVRACGSGAKVLFAQLLKSGDSSELQVLKSLDGITVRSGTPVNKFSFAMTEEEKEVTRVHNASFLRQLMEETRVEYDLLVIDECMGAIGAGLLDETIVVELLDQKRQDLEVVLTGRNPSKKMIERADYVSEIQKIKHPYDKNISARKGIEK